MIEEESRESLRTHELNKVVVVSRFIPLRNLSAVVLLILLSMAGANAWAQAAAGESEQAAVEAVAETSDEPAVESESEAIQETVLGGVTEGAVTDSVIAEGPIATHNAWMLVCCALVLFMTAPGLAMFYGGLVRRKNVLSVMMQCIFLMGLMTVIWACYGYSLAFGGEGGWIGNFDYVFMNGVQREWHPTGQPVRLDHPRARGNCPARVLASATGATAPSVANQQLWLAVDPGATSANHLLDFG